MRGIHRNARIGYLVWGGFAVLCLLVGIVAREQERAALTERVGAAERQALEYGDSVLHRALDARAVSAPLTGTSYRELTAVIQDRMLSDPQVARVRLWAPDGTLLYSSAPNERDKIGRLRVNEDPAITAAAGGAVSSRLANAPFTAAGSGERAVPTDLFESFVPLRVPDRTGVLGVAQIDRYYGAMRSAAAVPWWLVRWTCVGLAVLFFALALRSFRRRSPPTLASPATSPAERSTRADDAAARPAETRDEAIAALRAEHQDEIAALRAEYQEEIAALRAEHEEALAALRAEPAVATVAAAERERLAEAERRASEAEDRAYEAERRASRLEVMVTDTRREAQEAIDEALAARGLSSPAAAPLEAQAFELLEARVIAAEDRAADAEQRLAELGFEGPRVSPNGRSAAADAPAERDPAEFEGSEGSRTDDDEPDVTPVFPISAEASDLRARLARSAAIKRRSIEG